MAPTATRTNQPTNQPNERTNGHRANASTTAHKHNRARRDYWARFEKFTRDLTRPCESVYIVSGPLFLPRRKEGSRNPKAAWAMGYDMIGESPTGLVAVPTHFFKLVLAERKGDGRRLVAAFVLPNAAIPPEMPLSNFLVPLGAFCLRMYQ